MDITWRSDRLENVYNLPATLDFTRGLVLDLFEEIFQCQSCEFKHVPCSIRSKASGDDFTNFHTWSNDRKNYSSWSSIRLMSASRSSSPALPNSPITPQLPSHIPRQSQNHILRGTIVILEICVCPASMTFRLGRVYKVAPPAK